MQKKEENKMQMNRLFEIVYILLNKRHITAKKLAEHFEVSVRTIYRDVERLSEAGIPIYMNKGNGGGIMLLPNFILNKTVLTEQEKADILSALGALGAVNAKDMEDTIRKFENLFGDLDANWIEVNFGLWSDGEKEAALFQLIKQSILKKQVVNFRYVNVKGEGLNREVEPLKLVFKGTAWYLYGFCRIRGDYRFFRLKRISDFMQTDKQYVRHIPKTVIASRQAAEKDELIKVKVRIEPPNTYLVYDDFMDCEMQADGSVIAQSTFRKTDWIVNYLLGYGETCEVIEPLELRAEIECKLEKLLKKYKRN